jgi:hypothetical protein
MAGQERNAPVYGRGSVIAGIAAVVLLATIAILRRGVFPGTDPASLRAFSVAFFVWLAAFLGVIGLGAVCGVLSLARGERPSVVAGIGIYLCVLCFLVLGGLLVLGTCQPFNPG